MRSGEDPTKPLPGARYRNELIENLWKPITPRLHTVWPLPAQWSQVITVGGTNEETRDFHLNLATNSAPFFRVRVEPVQH